MAVLFNRTLVIGAALTALSMAVSPVVAQTNTGFESGSLSPWFQTDNSVPGGADWQATMISPHSGSWSATTTGNKELRQDFAGVAVGSIVSASFWLRHPDSRSAPAFVTTFYADMTENGAIFTTTGLDWERINFSSLLQPGKTLTGFSIFGYSGGGAGASPATFFDDFSLSFATAAAVPEPASWGLMILGFGAVGSAARYRRRSTRVAVAT